MTVALALSNPAKLSEVEKDAIRSQLERVLANRHFSHSRRFPAFLRFVVEKVLTGGADQLKERTLGVEIFGRDPEYDTSSDPIVRVTAAEIRKRIAQYYQEDGHESELRIMLEAGSYVPQFRWPHEVAVAEKLPVVTLLEPVGEPGATIAPEIKRSRWWLAVAAGVVGLAVAAAVGLWGSQRSSPVDFFWGPLLSAGDPPLFCLVDQNATTNLAVDAANPARQTIVSTAMQVVNMDDLTTIVKMGSLLRVRGKRYALKGAASTTLSDLRTQPTIYVGAFDNAWTMRLTRRLRYRFGNDADFKQEWIEDSASKQAPQWFTERPKEESANNYREYALIARFTDPDTGQLSVVVAGIGQGSTLAAGEFVTDAEGLGQLERMAKAAGGKKNLEAVLSTQIIDGQPGSAKIEATYFW